MGQKVSAGVIVIAVVVLVAFVGAMYWFTFGKGASRTKVDEQWSKPVDMRAIPPGRGATPTIVAPGGGMPPPVGNPMPPAGGPGAPGAGTPGMPQGR